MQGKNSLKKINPLRLIGKSLSGNREYDSGDLCLLSGKTVHSRPNA